MRGFKLTTTMLRACLTATRQPVDSSVVALKEGPADFFSYADMAELADALGSGPSGRKVVEVRVLLSAPQLSSQLSVLSFVQSKFRATESSISQRLTRLPKTAHASAI